MRTSRFVDTNIFLRYLIPEDPVKTKACLALFQLVQRNQFQITTSEAVVAEVVYVLGSKKLYHLPRLEIKNRLHLLLLLPSFKLSHRKTYLRALDLYSQSNLDFEDCLTIAQMERQKLTELYSYDRGFNQISGIKRLEP
jgi:uncharacterized protein